MYAIISFGLVMPGFMIYITVYLIQFPHKIQIIGSQSAWNRISTYLALAITGIINLKL